VARPKPWEIEDGRWDRIELLSPKVERRFLHPGRKRLNDRAALCGILFVLYTAIPLGVLAANAGVRVRDDLLASRTPADCAQNHLATHRVLRLTLDRIRDGGRQCSHHNSRSSR
jgi:hypothetical protein